MEEVERGHQDGVGGEGEVKGEIKELHSGLVLGELEDCVDTALFQEPNLNIDGIGAPEAHHHMEVLVDVEN